MNPDQFDQKDNEGVPASSSIPATKQNDPSNVIINQQTVYGDFQPEGYQQSSSLGSKQSNFKKILAITIAVIVIITLAVAGWFLGATDKKPTDKKQAAASASSDSKNNDAIDSSAEDTAGQYVDSQGQYKITPPEGWNPFVSADKVEFSPSSAPSEAAVRPTLTVRVEPTNGATLDQLVEALKLRLAEESPGDRYGRKNFKNLSTESKTINKMPATIITSSFTLVETVDFMQIHLVTVKGDKVFTVTGTADSVVWDQYKDSLQESLLSLKV